MDVALQKDKGAGKSTGTATGGVVGVRAAMRESVDADFVSLKQPLGLCGEIQGTTSIRSIAIYLPVSVWITSVSHLYEFSLR